MQELQTINHFITSELFVGYAVYSIIWVLSLLFFRSNKFIASFDASACKFMVWLGILYTILWASEMIVYYTQLDDLNEKISFENRMNGPYAYGLFLQSFIWLALSQMLRMDAFRTSWLFRVSSSLLFLFSLEKMIQFTTSFHREFTHGVVFWPLVWYSILIKFVLFMLVILLARMMSQSFHQISINNKLN